MFMDVREEDAEAAAEFGWRPNSVDPFQYLAQSQVLQEWALAGSDTQIARIPYKCTSRQSKIALSWILEKQHMLRDFFNHGSIHIRHAFNHYTEFIAEDGHKVDGYAEYDGIQFLFQFYGCYWHGCTTCNNPEDEHPHFKIPYRRVYEQTLKQEELLTLAYERSGKKWQLHTIWEHEYTMGPFFQGYDLPTLSDVMGDRDMFSGGHVNVFQPLVRADTDEGEHIRCIDITSHYPNICAHYPCARVTPNAYWSRN
jgi:hypothetical protein